QQQQQQQHHHHRHHHHQQELEQHHHHHHQQHHSQHHSQHDPAPGAYRSNAHDRYSHGNFGARPASFSAASSSSSSSPSSYSTAVRPTAPGQRSASWNVGQYDDYPHSYEEEHQRRTDRAKSDYALHQQNYGPYLNDSPPLAPATLPKAPASSGYYYSSASSSSSSSTKPAGQSSSGHVTPANPSSPSASYAMPPPHSHSHHSSSRSLHSTMTTAAAPSTRLHDAPHAPAENGSADHRRQAHGPILPPPA
ncbi:hypothetical protein BGW38_009860, partial [Lunasporangiospora selenospora]